MYPIGQSYDRTMLSTKYDFTIPPEVIEKTVRRLTNQLWKLIPMRENKEDWEKQLDTMIVEIAGLNEVFLFCPQFLQVLAKLEGIKLANVQFEIFRKTIFESISLI